MTRARFFLIAFVATLLTLLSAAPAARADSVLVGTGPGVFSGGDCPCDWYVQNTFDQSPPVDVAAQFSLSGPSFVTTINLMLEIPFSGDQLTLSLVSSLTGTGTTIGSQTYTYPGPDASFNVLPVSFTFDATLAPGTYYLVLSSSSALGDGWEGSDNTLIENAGTVADGMWLSSDGGTTWSFYAISNPICPFGCQPGIFAVDGTSIAATPEPHSAVLLGLGLLMLIGNALTFTRLSGRAKHGRSGD
ncbi:MAG: hypothetical protein WAN10_16435 [Candidatus Acidiferrales bacterium]